MYISNYYAIPAIVSTITYAVLIAYVLWKNPRHPLNQAAVMFFLSLGWWSFGEWMERWTEVVPENYTTALFWGRFLGVGAMLVGPAILHFALELGLRKRLKSWQMILLYSPMPVLIFILMDTALFVPTMEVYFAGWGTTYSTILVYFGYPYVQVFIALGLFFYSYFKADTLVRKYQLKYVLIGAFTSLFCVTGTLTIPNIMGVTIFPLTTVSFFAAALSMAYATVKYKLLVIEAVTEAEILPEAVEKKLPEVTPGYSYLLKEVKPDMSYRMFRRAVSNVPGICFTTTYPQKIRTKYGLAKTPVIWLTPTDTEKDSLQPEKLEFEIAHTIISFIEENKRAIVFIDGVEYLLIANPFRKVFPFIKHLGDLSAIKDSMVLVSLNPKALERPNSALLEKEMIKSIDLPPNSDVVCRDVEEVSLKIGYSYLVDSRLKVFVLLHRFIRTNNIPMSSVVCISPIYPGKLIEDFGIEDAMIYWLSDREMELDYIMKPQRLEFEITDTILSFIKSKKPSVTVVLGIDYLILTNGFDKTFEFVKLINDIASQNDGIVIGSINPRALNEKDYHTVAKVFDYVVGGDVKWEDSGPRVTEDLSAGQEKVSSAGLV